MNDIDSLTNLPTSVQVIMGILIAGQLLAMVWALVRLAGDKRERIAGLPRPLWLAIIVLGQLVGPVVFLILHIRERRAIAEQDRFHGDQQSKQKDADKSASTIISDLYRE